jgi:uncharacterized repeat protein (TIGR03806 family)
VSFSACSRAIVTAALLVLVVPLHGQDTPRVLNETLLIDLREGGPPPTISASGLYSDVATRTVSPGIIPYEVNSPLWSDGTWKERFIALPGSAQVEFSAGSSWSFPPNTVLVKNFGLEEEVGQRETRFLIETRFLVRNAATAGWSGFSYQWTPDGQDAVLLEREAVESYFLFDSDAEDGFREQIHYFPNRSQCDQCHLGAADHVLGVTTAQLNRLVDGVQQLAALSDAGLFSQRIVEGFDQMPAMADPLDESADLEARARSYLAANCAHCHRPGAVDKADIDLRLETPLDRTKTINRVPTLATFDLVDPRLIKPGDAANSSLYQRTLAIDSGRMPPLGTELVDVLGTDAVRRWIEAMNTATTVGVHAGLPEGFQLDRNYPNPFNAATTMAFRLSDAGRVRFDILDVSGRLVRRLIDTPMPAGRHTVSWDGKNESGEIVASGVYLYQLRSGPRETQRRLTLLK